MPDSAPLSPARLTPKVEELRVTTGPFPSSRKIHMPGRLHPEISVAMREIDLEPAANEPPVRTYDTSGLYSDPHVEIDITKGLPELRKPWILARGDVEYYEGRDVRPEDNGLRRGEASSISLFDRRRRQVLRAKPGAAVTQIAMPAAASSRPRWNMLRSAKISAGRNCGAKALSMVNRSARRSPIT